jgi:IS5 family transposase
LAGKRHAIAARHVELAFANHVHEFDAGQNSLRRSERFESEQRPGDALDGAVILLNDIVKVFDLPDPGWDASVRIQLVERVLAAELTHHLANEDEASRNHRNGTTPRKVLASGGELQLDVPRDRLSSFEPKLLAKHQRCMPEFDVTPLACHVGASGWGKRRWFKRMHRALQALRSRVGRVQRDIERQLQRVPPEVRERLDELLDRTRRILQQRPKDKNKLYAPHAPEVECISKGKARVRYEFGVKVSIVTTLKEGLIVGARSMPGNPYDGHTLHEALEQAAILSDVEPEMVFVDRGYKGGDVEHVQVWRSGQKRGVARGVKAMIRRRSAIEPTIGHMKSDGKLGRNWLKGVLGDALNAVLCGAGHNLRLVINKLKGACQPGLIY